MNPNKCFFTLLKINVIISTDEPKKLAISLKDKFNINVSFITRCPNYNRIKKKSHSY
jgi:hypothetical protein